MVSKYSWLAIALLIVFCGLTSGFAQDKQRMLSAVPASSPQVPQFGGPASVGGQLTGDHADRNLADLSGKPAALSNFAAFKKRIHARYGLALGLDYNALVETASHSFGEHTAAGGVFRFFGTWTLFGSDGGDTGALTFKLENRHRLGTAIAPQDLAVEIGYAGLTSVTYSDAGTVLTNLFWQQSLLDNRMAYVVGIVDVTDYVDVYGLSNPWTDFNNLAFSTNPTIPAPSQGLGAAVRWRFEDNHYVLAGLADANGNPSEPGNAFNSFFDRADYFKHFEIGWVSSWENRFTDNIHLTLWHSDANATNGIESGWGAAVSYSHRFGPWLPFFRAGYSDGGGALWDRSVSAGVGFFPDNEDDLLAFGINWARPSSDTFGTDLGDQITAEAFYRFEIFPNTTITPSAQLLINPALDPDTDSIWVLGLRFRSSL